MEGFLFQVEARTREERLAARRASIPERVKACAELVLKYGPCGNLNTQLIAGEKQSPILSTQSVAGRREADPRIGIGSTCEIGTETTERRSRPITEILSIGPGATNGLEIDTPTTRSTKTKEKRKSKNGKNETPTSDSLSASGSSDLPRSNTGQCSPSKAEPAQSAELPSPDDTADSTLTTATKQVVCGDCCASGVISESGSSVTFPNILSGPRNSHDDQWLIWCGLNPEQDAIAALCGDQCVSIYGRLSDAEKESRLDQWLRREKRILISKPSIFGFGLNFQQCSNVVFLGLSDSYESFYQSVRRCWRFGQTRPVNCYIITSEQEGAVVKNIERKERDAMKMAREMVKHMSVYNTEAVHGTVRTGNGYEAARPMTLPQWIPV
jgi:hypothetical protein